MLLDSTVKPARPVLQAEAVHAVDGGSSALTQVSRVAIMQPYLFPYLGYFCLARACDVMVYYDDVNYISRGWINRNRILINGAPHRFTLPTSNGSQNALIRDVRTHDLVQFRTRFVRQLECAYRKAPYFDVGLSYATSVLDADTELVADLAIRSVQLLFERVGLRQVSMRASEFFGESRGTDRTERLIGITRQLGAAHYINSMGGSELYDKAHFRERGVRLSFVDPRLRSYRQAGATEFIAGLSIIDVLMNNDPAEVAEMIEDFELV